MLCWLLATFMFILWIYLCKSAIQQAQTNEPLPPWWAIFVVMVFWSCICWSIIFLLIRGGI